MTIPESEELMPLLEAYWPTVKLTERSPEAYRTALGDCPYWIVVESLPAIVRDQPRWCPTPGELLGFVTAKPGEAPNPRDLPRLIAEGICTPDGLWAGPAVARREAA